MGIELSVFNKSGMSINSGVLYKMHSDSALKGGRLLSLGTICAMEKADCGIDEFIKRTEIQPPAGKIGAAIRKIKDKIWKTPSVRPRL